MYAISLIIGILTLILSLIFIVFVKTDVGILCSVLVFQCGWMIMLFADMRQIAIQHRRDNVKPLLPG